MTQEFQIAVIGAGPAGLMAALWAARSGANVVLLESAEKAGQKFLMADDGRCNLLPAKSEADDFFTSGSRNVLRRLFRTWRLQQLRDFFTWELNVPLEEEEETGRLFPENHDAAEFREVMLQAVAEAGVTILCSSRVESVAKVGERFALSNASAEITCEQVILACGGQERPHTGSDGHGYRIAKEFGHKLLPTYPVLVEFHTSDREFTALSGLTLPVQWRAEVGGKVVGQGSGDFQFKEQGFGGSAVLDASHFVVRDKATILMNWGCGSREEWIPYLKARTRQGLFKAISPQIPLELLQVLFNRGGLRGEMRSGLLDRGTTETLLTHLCDFPLPINGTGGFQRARGTGGGVPLDQMNPSTLESRTTPGLYFCGEILDVFGPSGGYNLQWAFTTGRLAGESAAKMLIC